MKRSYMKHYSYYLLLFLPALATFFFSCDTYNFSHPQPVNKENIYEFPAVFRGNWMDDDSEQVLISKNSIGLIMNEQLSIVKGVWPKQNEAGKYLYLSPFYKGFSSVLFDSLQKPIDTISNYFLNGDHIYEIGDKGLLEQGYHYKIMNDTFSVAKKDTMLVDLGQNAFLRDIGNGFFVINMRNQVLGQENRWWQLFVLEIKDNDNINTWYCSSGLTKNETMFYEKHNNYYFNSAWTSTDMIKLIRGGGFEMCNQLHRNKVKTSGQQNP